MPSNNSILVRFTVPNKVLEALVEGYVRAVLDNEELGISIYDAEVDLADRAVYYLDMPRELFAKIKEIDADGFFEESLPDYIEEE